MNSPARRHFQQTMAAQEAAKAAETGNRRDLNQYELMQAQVHEHRLQLKNIQSIEAKGKKKAEILPEYYPYILGVLAADAGLQDDVLMTVMIWAIDAGNYDDALKLAEYAIKHDLTPPDQYQRTTATIIAEEIAETAIKHSNIDLVDLRHAADLVMDKDMPDEVKGKLHKALGLNESLQEEEPQTALNHLQEADSKMKKANVKTAMKALQKQIAEAEKNNSQ